MLENEVDNLVKNAINVKNNSYSPYSNFRVGAALLTENNIIVLGVNIENISFTPTVCAERSAFFTSIVSGEREFRAIAIATDDETFSPPCGVCRQVMAEFVKSDFKIILVNKNSELKIVNFQDIFPFPFEPSESIGMKD